MKKLIVAALLLLPLTLSACGAPAAESSTPTEPTATQVATAPSAVHVDYSKLTPYEVPEEKYTYHEGYVKGELLQARDDYGALLPYCGTEDDYGSLKYSEDMKEWVGGGTFYLYGLVTDKGEIVTDPIYHSIAHKGDCLELQRPRIDCLIEDTFYTVAALDGSWVLDLEDSVPYEYDDYGHVIARTVDDRFYDVWNTKGEHMSRFAVSLFDGCSVLCGFDDTFGCVVDWDKNRVLYANFETGEVLDTAPAGYPATYTEYEKREKEKDKTVYPKIGGCKKLYALSDEVSRETYFYGKAGDHTYYTLFDADGNVIAEHFDDEHDNGDISNFCVTDIVTGKRYICSSNYDYRYYTLRDVDGNVLTERWYHTFGMIRAGLYPTVEGGRFCYRTIEDGTLVFCRAIQTNGD